MLHATAFTFYRQCNNTSSSALIRKSLSRGSLLWQYSQLSIHVFQKKKQKKKRVPILRWLLSFSWHLLNIKGHIFTFKILPLAHVAAFKTFRFYRVSLQQLHAAPTPNKPYKNATNITVNTQQRQPRQQQHQHYEQQHQQQWQHQQQHHQQEATEKQ